MTTPKPKDFRKELKKDMENPLFLMFIHTALHAAVVETLRDKEKVHERMKNSIIHPDAWISVAEAIKEIL